MTYVSEDMESNEYGTKPAARCRDCGSPSGLMFIWSVEDGQGSGVYQCSDRCLP